MELTTISGLRQECFELYQELGSYSAVAEELRKRYPELPRVNWLRKLVKIESQQAEYEAQAPVECSDAAVQKENARLAAQVQKATDTNRIERAAWRTQSQAFNVLEELQTQILETLKAHGKALKDAPRYHTSAYNPENPVAVVSLSDLHMNELINLPHNTYDFEVAAKRLQLLAQKVKLFAQAAGCQRVVVTLGGDIINSDRRLDEVLSMATNRARAVVLATHLLRQFVMDLRSSFYVDLFGITGNEGRAKQELAWGDPAVTDNYDGSVYWMLEHLLTAEPDKGLRVHPLQGNECFFQVHNQTFLLIHGHQINASDQRKVQSLIGKHSAEAGQQVTHVLCGHIHSSLVGDFITRNASLAGANAYSSEGLSFASKAAQTMQLVDKRGLDGIKLDLQNTDGVDGYEIVPQLEAHCAKSVDKAHRVALNKTQVRIVV